MKKIQFKRLQYFKVIEPFVRENKIISFLIIFFKLLCMCITISLPLVYKYYMNQVIMVKKTDNLIYVLLAYIILFILETLFIGSFKFFETYFINKLKINVKTRLLENYTNMDYEEYEQQNVGDIRLRIEEDTKTVCDFYTNQCVDYVFSICGMLIMIGMIFALNMYLSIFGLLMIGLSFYITKVIAEKIKKVSGQYRGNQGEFENMLKDILYNWKEVKTNNLEEQTEVLLTDKWAVLSQLLMKHTFFQYIYGAIIAVNLVFVTRMNLYFMGGILIIHKMLNVATMLVFMNYYEQIFSYVQSISDSIVKLNSDAYQLSGIMNMLGHKKEKIYTPVELKQIEGNLRFENVTFHYPLAEKGILKNVSICMDTEKKTAVIGKSGTGKTTLAKILLGLYEPNEGNIYIDDINLNGVIPYKRNKIINAVMQDPILLNISILDNIRLAKPEATLQEVDEVCKKANIYDFIQSIPEKYDTLIGERGLKLSGGQRQRIAIARTLLLNPKIIIFDEATSSLDSENESKVIQAIEEVAESNRIIIIAHRFCTIRSCENVIVLNEDSMLRQMSMNELKEDNRIISSIFINK